MANIPNLSAAVSLIYRFNLNEIALHEDVDAFHAPSECHDLVSKGVERKRRVLRRRVHGLTGYRYSLVVREAKRRVSYRWFHFNFPGAF